MPQLYRRKGGEILVNTETLNTQSSGNLALLSNGGFVVVWIDGSMIGSDTSGFGIKAQRFDADGNKLGAEFLVNTTTSANQTGPVVATLPSGRFVVTWIDASATGGDTSGTAVRGQIFEANGTPVGAEFLINTEIANNQGPATVTELSGGGFVVSWSDGSGVGGDASGTGIKAQLFDSAGAKVGGEILVNTVVVGSQGSSSLIGLAGGGFAVAWQGAAVISGGLLTGSIRLQLFDSGGAKVGTEQVVSTEDEGNFNSPNITALASGFIVTWTKQDSPLGVGIPITFDVRGQLFDSSGAKVGAEFVVNTTTAETQSAPDVDAVPGGGFLVTWQGQTAGSTDFNIYGQFFSDSGAKVGGEFVVNSVTAGNQTTARVDVLASGDIVVIWTDNSALGSDTSGSGIKMQILTQSSAAPTDIALTTADITEVSIENLAVATLSAINNGGLNSAFTYQIVSDSSGGAFRIEGDRLIVDDNGRLDFETQPNVSLRIRVTDLNGTSYEEDFTVAVRDVASEVRYSAGDEFRVNTDTSGFNVAVAMTALASGGFAVVTYWLEMGIGDGYRLQIFDAAGAPVGAERDLDLLERGGSFMAVTGLPSGGFVIAYEGNSIDLGGGSNGYPVRAQLFDAAGNEVGADLLVSQTNGEFLAQPRVTTLSSGGFVVTWSLPIHEDGSGNGGPFPSQIMARIYDAGGAPLGNEFRANTGIENSQVDSRVAALPNGGFVIAWEEFEAGTIRIEAQIFNAAGAKVGGELVLHTLSQTGSNELSDYRLTALATGSVLVSWVQRFAENPDVYAILGRVLAPDGTMGATMYLVAATFGATHEMAALPGGGFVLTADTLDHFDPDFDDYQTFGLIFDAAGGRVGDGFMVPESAADAEILPFVTVLASGDIAFTWTRQFVENNSVTNDTYARILTLVDGSGDIIGTPGPDVLNGTAGADHIYGLAGNDLLTGGAGDDLMSGGAGDDTYIVDDAGDVVVESAGQGFDIVFSSVTYTLGAGVDVEVLSARVWEATSALDLTGNEIVNTLIGNAGANRLHGGGGNDIINGREGDDVLFGDAGADTLNGGTGNDIYVVEDSGDAVFENAGEGHDVIFAAVSYTLPENSEIEVLSARFWEDTNALNLTGSSTANVLIGNAGDNILDGAGGADNMSGREGNDIYVVDNLGDIVTELAAQGTDVVFASVSYTLAAGSEVEVLSARFWEATSAINLTGNEFANNVIGNAGNNILHGGGGNDIINGREGDDVIWGDAGADAMSGGLGNDIYVVEDTADAVFENAAEGTDIIFSAVTYTLPEGSEIEVLSARFWEDTTAISLTGSSTANTLIGNAGSNVLDGGGGIDTMSGREGNDFYIVDNAGDVATELAGQGTDTLLTFVSYTLAADTEIEILSARFWEDTTAISLTGNAIANTVIGNAGANTINGGAGNDTLTGNAGADSFAFTTALGAANIDAITDFAVGIDKIRLAGAGGEPFAALASGALAAGAFVIGSQALQADDYIIYNSTTGALLYDADGVGGNAAVQFATLATGLSLSAADFQVSGALNNAPAVTSGATASVTENSPAANIVYQATATDADGDRITWSLGGADAGLFSIDAVTGAVRLITAADFETKTSYTFSVIASDSGPTAGVQSVSLAVINVNDTSSTPIINETAAANDSTATAQVIDRNTLTVNANPDLTNQALPSATIQGNIVTINDIDYYAITLQIGEQIILDIDHSTGGLDPFVRIFGPNGGELGFNDDLVSFDPGSVPTIASHNTDSYLTFRAPTTGTFYFSVESFGDLNNDGDDDGPTVGESSGTYSLNVSIGPPATAAQLIDEDINALISGARWQTTSLTYGFPTLASQYPAGIKETNDTDNFEPFSAAQQAVVTAQLGMISQVTSLVFTLNTATPGSTHLRYALSDEAEVAYAYYPPASGNPGGLGGSAWFNNTSPRFDNPVLGNYAWMGILHETGHALGLKHGHEFPAVQPDRDSVEYTVMTYRSYPGKDTSTGYSNETFGFAQSLMMYDIAALQRIYGANFGTNAGNTVYTFSSTTGEMSIDGAGQGVPGANRVFRTIWDGGGTDTYDMSNYGSLLNLTIDLRPGEWTKLGGQLAGLGSGNFARGNIANALMFEGNTASLIENAIGGAGADILIANQVANQLTGNANVDTFKWMASTDAGTGALADTIADFLRGTDKIDLSNIDAIAGAGDDAFSFIGTGAFTNSAGQLRYEVTGGHAHIFADLDGNGIADMEIVVNNVGTLTGTDFIL